MVVLYSNWFSLQLDTWFLYLIWIGIFSALCCVFCVVLFFYVMAQFFVLTVFFCVVVLFMLLIVLCSSSCYVCTASYLTVYIVL